jgi:YVTN family beta-propeller protein
VSFAAHRHGKKAVVVNEGSGSISVINASTGATVGTVRVGGEPSPAALSPDQRVFAVVSLPSRQTTADANIVF